MMQVYAVKLFFAGFGEDFGAVMAHKTNDLRGYRT